MLRQTRNESYVIGTGHRCCCAGVTQNTVRIYINFLIAACCVRHGLQKEAAQRELMVQAAIAEAEAERDKVRPNCACLNPLNHVTCWRPWWLECTLCSVMVLAMALMVRAGENRACRSRRLAA